MSSGILLSRISTIISIRLGKLRSSSNRRLITAKLDSPIAPAQYELKEVDIEFLREFSFENDSQAEVFDVPYNAMKLENISNTLHSVLYSVLTLVFEQEILRSLKFEDMRMANRTSPEPT